MPYISSTPIAEQILNAGISAAKSDGFDAADRAIDRTLAELGVAVPPGYQSQITEALAQIAKAHIRQIAAS